MVACRIDVPKGFNGIRTYADERLLIYEHKAFLAKDYDYVVLLI